MIQVNHSLRNILQRAKPFHVHCAKGFDPNPKPKPQPRKEKNGKSALGIGAQSSGVKEEERVRAPPPQVPSYVANRVLGRIAVFSGVPAFLGVALLPLFYYLKAVKEIDVPIFVVYLIQLFTFGGGLFGISYAVLSTGGNQDDFIGFETFKSNLENIIKGEK